MGMRKIGIMELMICTVFPVKINRPMAQITAIMAIIIGDMIMVREWKKRCSP